MSTANSIDDMINETLALVEKDSAAKTNAAPVSSDANLSQAVADLKDVSKTSDPSSAAAAPKPTPGDKLLEDMKNAFTDENYLQMMDKIIASETSGQSSPSKEKAPEKASTEGDFAKNIGECMKQLKTEEDHAVGGDFFTNFMKSFEGAMDNDENFSKSVEFLMSGMLSNNVLCDSLRQVVDLLNQYLNETQCTPEDRLRYEHQLRLYKEIMAIYAAEPNEISAEQMEEVNKKLLEVQTYGSLPKEVMDKVKGSPGEEAPDGDDANFEDFVKSMGLNQSLGEQEQEMIKQLSANPAELENIMAEMANEMKSGEEPCKQQ